MSDISHFCSFLAHLHLHQNITKTQRNVLKVFFLLVFLKNEMSDNDEIANRSKEVVQIAKKGFFKASILHFRIFVNENSKPWLHGQRTSVFISSVKGGLNRCSISLSVLPEQW